MGSEIPQEASNSDEYFLQHSLVFAESLKDLRNIRAQLYSAAEYFESSCDNDEHKQPVNECLKAYLTKALISTVDHLGSVAYKVNSFLDKKVDEISAASLQFSCIEQRLWAHREFIGRTAGLLGQLPVTETPRHYRRYSIPVVEKQGLKKLNSVPDGCLLTPLDDVHQLEQDDCFAKSFRGTPIAKPDPPLRRRGHSRHHSAEFSLRPLNFSFMRTASSKELGKQAVSPSFPLKRSGSINNRSISPRSNTKQRCPSEPGSSITMLLNPERSKGNELHAHSRKSKHLFKAIFNIYRSRKQGIPQCFRDD